MKRFKSLISTALIVFIGLLIGLATAISQPVKLPDELRRLQIKFMKVGEVGFCRQRAMVVNEEGNCYLEAHTELEKVQGHEEMKIERKADGYYVGVVPLQKGWIREFIHYEGDKIHRGDLIPVKKINIEPKGCPK